MFSIHDAFCFEDLLAGDNSWSDFSNESAVNWMQAAAALPVPSEEFTQYSSREAGIPSDNLTSFARSTMVSSSKWSASRATANNSDWSVFASPSERLQRRLNKASPTLGTGHLLSNCTMMPFSSSICSAVPVLPKNNDAFQHSAHLPPAASYQHRSSAAQVPADRSVSASGIKRNWCDSGYSSAELSSLRNGSSDRSKGLKSADEATPYKKACLRQGSHVKNEQARRQSMNRNFEALKTILPGEHGRIDKASVVNKTISYIKALEEQLKNLREQRNELKQNVGIASRSCASSGRLADVKLEARSDGVSASKLDRRKCGSPKQPSSTSSNCIRHITVGVCHASFTLYMRKSKKGFLPELLAAMEVSKQHVQHVYVRQLEASTVYMIHTQVADESKEAEEEKIRAMLQKVLNDTRVSLEEA